MEKPGKNSNEDELTSILPSYEMFTSTVSRALNSLDEDFSREPPMYELMSDPGFTPISAMPSPFSPLLPDQNGNEFPFPIFVQPENEQPEIWENTIIANIHKLKNLSKYDHKVSKNLDIQLYITKDVCKKGIPPEIIDVKHTEFKQGDYIHGYVTIENVSDTPFSFEMVYVILEGELVVLENKDGFIDTQTPHIVHKFLNMIDLFASWTYSNINRLATDNGSPHDWCEGDTDPYDNTLLSIDLLKKLLPGKKYKRFFSFKVPDKLLDDICDVHTLDGHTQLLPSLGYARYHKKPSSRYTDKTKLLQDLTFLDTSISYHLACRVIGKSHDYGFVQEANQFIIPCETVFPIRLIPVANYFYVENPVEIMRYYKGFISSIKERIDFGNNLEASRNSLNELSLTPLNSSDSKIRQLFKSTSSKLPLNPTFSKQFEDSYRNTIPYKRKTLMSSKSNYSISLSTPKTEYKIKYIPPMPYRQTPIDESNLILKIPLQITYFDSSGKHFPDIKAIKAELVAGTLRSNKHLIPVEFCHEFFINDEELHDIGHKSEATLFQERVNNIHKKSLKELTDLINKLGGDNIQVDRKLYHDLKALAGIHSKFSVFEIDDTLATVSGTKMDIDEIQWLREGESFTKTFDFTLNLQNCFSKLYGINKNSKFFDHVTLVPDFQSCIAIRLYYIKVIIKLVNGDSIVVKVPLRVERPLALD